MYDFTFLPPSWAQCVEHWLQSIENHSGSTDSRETYASILVRFFKFIDKSPGSASRADVASWLAQPGQSKRLPGKPLSASCKNQRISCLNSFYSYASAYEIDGKPLYDRALPCVGMRILKRDFQARQMSDAEIRAFFDALPDSQHGYRLRTIFYLYLILGRRKAELMRLKFGDIQPAMINGQPAMTYRYTGKGNSRVWKTKELPSEAYATILEYLKSEGRLETIQPGDYIFRNNTGKGNKARKGDHLSADWISLQFHRTALKAGLPVERLSLHSLRWSSAYHRSMAGETLTQVRDALDHSSSLVTEHYLSGMKAEHDSGAALLVRKFSFLR